VDQILTTIPSARLLVRILALGNKWSGERAGVCFHAAAFLPFQPGATTESAFKIKPRVRRGRVCEKKGEDISSAPEARGRVINHTASEYN